MSYGTVKEELKQLCENGWDLSFIYNGIVCGIFPKTSNDFSVYIGNQEFHASSYDELVTLEIEGTKLPDIIKNSTEIQYY
ncbi:TPA: 16S rRNA processing protein RimM [Streptococcus suis]